MAFPLMHLRPQYLCGWLLALVFAVAFAPRTLADGSAASLRVEEKAVASFPGGYAPMLSTMGTFLVAENRGGEQAVIHPIVGRGPWITELDQDLVGESPDGLHIGYPARLGGRDVMFVDHRIIDGHVPAHSKPFSSPDGSHWAFIARKGGKEYVVLDGQAGTVYDEIGKHSCLCFDGSGRHLAFPARENGKWRVVVDGAPGKPYPDILSPGPQFDPTGTHVFYLAKQSGKTVPVIDGIEGQPVDAVLVSASPRFSSTGGRVAFGARFGQGARMVVDGQPGAEYEQVYSPSFSPDGNHFAYLARRGGAWTVVIDGREGPRYEAVSTSGIVMSRDGARHAYVVKSGGQWQVVVDGKRGPKHFAVSELTPRFSDDGSRVAYVAIAPDSTVTSFVDGIAGPAFSGASSVAPFFAGNEWHVALSTRDLRHVVLDGVEGPAYDRVILPIIESADGISYYAARGDSIYHVRHAF